MKSLVLAVVLIAPGAAARELGAEMSAFIPVLEQARVLKTSFGERPPAPAPPRSLPELLQALDDADPMVRLLAIQKLEPYVKTDLSVRKRLLVCLADPAVEIRSLTIVTLGSVAQEDDSVRRAIQELFLKDDADPIKLSGMDVLWSRIPTDAAVRARVLGILKTPIRHVDDLFVVDQALISMMNAAVIESDSVIREAVLSVLRYDDSWFAARGLISSTAAEALRPLCRVPEVRVALKTAAVRGVGGAIDVLAGCPVDSRTAPGTIGHGGPFRVEALVPFPADARFMELTLADKMTSERYTLVYRDSWAGRFAAGSELFVRRTPDGFQFSILDALPDRQGWVGNFEIKEAHNACDGFLPPNNLRIPVGDVNALGIDQAAFDAVLTRVESIYAPIFAAKGKKLRVNRKWEDDTVNAGAMQFNNTWVINMYGGLARHKAVTAEGFALVACHEIGHHIGGYPKTDAVWPTNEGGSDYFATLKCLRRTFTGGEDTSKLDPVAVKSCASAHAAASDRKLCEAGALAGKSIAALFKDLRGQTTSPSFSTPDPAVVAKTNDAHPDTQCRLDTYYAGALCSKQLAEEPVDTEPIAGACTAAQGFTVGLRPKCWYKAPVGTLNAPSEKDMDDIIDAMAGSLSERGF